MPGNLTHLLGRRYFVTLLEAFGVDSVRTSLRWADKIGGVGLEWPLGAVIRSACTAENAGPGRCHGGENGWGRNP